MFRGIRSFWITVFALGCAFSWAGDESEKISIVDPLCDSSMRLYAALRDNPQSEEALVISPLSLGEAMGLATQGAVGDTQTQMNSFFGGLSAKQISTDLKVLRRQLREFAELSSDSFVFTGANSLWANNNPNLGFKMDDAYIRMAEQEFGAQARQLNFQDPATLGAINQWVSQQTREKIEKIISKLNDDDAAIILNAIYAKGEFLNHFNSITYGQFQGETTSYLTKTERMSHYSGNGVRAYSFDIGNPNSEVASQIALDIIFPQGSLDDLAKALSGERYREIVRELSGGSTSRIELTLPAASVAPESALKLKDPLKGPAFNMPIPFTKGKANFAPMLDRSVEGILWINDILHKGTYDLTPFGFEASAATAVIFAFEATSAPVDPPVAHKIDGPALHIIRHKPTGLPLFISEVSTGKKYDETEVAELVKIGAENDRYLSALLENGNEIRITRQGEKRVIAEMDSSGNVIRVIKELE